MKTFFSLCAVCLLLSASKSRAAESVEISKQTMAPFFAKFCLDCHGPDEQEGQVRLDTVSWQISNNDTAQRWQDLLDVLNSGDMPPEDENQPKPEELTPVLRDLTKSLLEARRRLTDNGGQIAMRRLNQREYVATIRELFGFKLSPNRVPPDAESDSFDTVGEDQYFTSSHFDEFYELAKDIVRQAFSWAGKPRDKVSVSRNDPEKKVTANFRKSRATHQAKVALIEQGKSWKEIGFKDEGEMKLFINRAKRGKDFQRYLKYPRVDEGQYVTPAAKGAGFPIRPDLRAKYKFRIHGGVREGQAAASSLRANPQRRQRHCHENARQRFLPEDNRDGGSEGSEFQRYSSNRSIRLKGSRSED